MKYYREIDILRGMAIIMVIVGHSIIVYPIDLMQVLWCNVLFQMVTVTHMPLFFMIAGFCFHRGGTFAELIKKKAKRLLIPYVVFNSGDMLCRALFSRLVNRPRSLRESLINMFFYGGEYWFLYVLFILCVIFALIINVVERFQWLQILLLIVAIAMNQWSAFGMNQIGRFDLVCKYFVFCYIGFLIKNYRESCGRWREKIDNVWCRSFVIIVWIVLYYRYYQTMEKNHVFLLLLVNCAGALVCLMLAWRISDLGIGRWLKEVGRYSLQLYLLNGYFLVISRTMIVQVLGITMPLLIVAGNAFVSVCVAILFIKQVLFRIPGMKYLCGEA